MKNSLNDLNNHLFAAFERLNDESLKGDELTAEAEEALGILSEGDVGSTAIAAAHIRKAIESYD